MQTSTKSNHIRAWVSYDFRLTDCVNSNKQSISDNVSQLPKK